MAGKLVCGERIEQKLQGRESKQIIIKTDLKRMQSFKKIFSKPHLYGVFKINNL